MKIGLEIHVQLPTKSKIFCSCSNKVSNNPNTTICEICTGQPGSKPVLNKEVLNHALRVALALNCKINKEMFFSRKSYFYPDLPKNYQITQYEVPLAEQGKLEDIRIRRIHIEEDPGKLIHQNSITLIDYNRSGTPLIEIVTEPDFENTEQVREFLNKLVTILEYLDVYKRTSELTMRTDANISTTGDRVEIKNINGIKDVQRALESELERQKHETHIKQHTRMWDSDSGKTIQLREKETEEDYGYIFEPDLTRIILEEKEIKLIRDSLPELADERARRYVQKYKIDPKDSEIICSELKLANMFEEIIKEVDPILTAKWLRRELNRVLNYNKKELYEVELNSNHVQELLELVQEKKITEQVAQKILEKLIVKPFSVKDYVKQHNLSTVSDDKQLIEICKKIMQNNPKAILDYKNGEQKSFMFLVGQIMRETRGAASPEKVNKLLKELINNS